MPEVSEDRYVLLCMMIHVVSCMPHTDAAMPVAGVVERMSEDMEDGVVSRILIGC